MTEQEFYKWLGEKFKKLRIEKGINHNQLAKEIGVPRSLLVEFEENGKKMSAFRINQLMIYFGMTTIKDSIGDFVEPPISQKKNAFNGLNLKQRLQRLLQAAEDALEEMDNGLRPGAPAKERQDQADQHGNFQEQEV